jgi:arabinogalactan endo-1,4-beta-galactosidase
MVGSSGSATGSVNVDSTQEIPAMHSVLRIRTIAVSAGIILAVGTPPSDAQISRETSKDFRVSVSVSPFTESMLARGIVYSDGTLTADSAEGLQRLFIAHGANEVYARIATKRKFQRGNADHSVERGLERALMAKRLDVAFNPELCLCRAYGDISHQPAPDFSDYPQIKLPDEWARLRLDQMLGALRSYGALVAREILDTGVEVRIWDLGNEVELGMAGVAVQPIPRYGEGTEGPNWYKPPDAVDPEIGKMSVMALLEMPETERIEWLQRHIWPFLAQMLAATAEGIRSVEPKARFSTHVSGIAAMQPAVGLAFFKALRDGGFVPDELGFSYYPTSNKKPPDRLETFKNTVMAVHRELGRPVFIAEFGYPAGRMEGAFDWNAAVDNYPQDAEGQATFVRDLVAWGAQAGLVAGIRPWAPDLVFGWGPMSLFTLSDKTAVARPSLDAIVEGLRLSR